MGWLYMSGQLYKVVHFTPLSSSLAQPYLFVRVVLGQLNTSYSQSTFNINIERHRHALCLTYVIATLWLSQGAASCYYNARNLSTW